MHGYHFLLAEMFLWSLLRLHHSASFMTHSSDSDSALVIPMSGGFILFSFFLVSFPLRAVMLTVYALSQNSCTTCTKPDGCRVKWSILTGIDKSFSLLTIELMGFACIGVKPNLVSVPLLWTMQCQRFRIKASRRPAAVYASIR